MSALHRTPAASGDDLVSLDTPPAPGSPLGVSPAAGHGETVGVDTPEFASARRFILQLAKQLHQHGTPAHRLEVTLSVLARRLGVQADFFSPSSVRTRLARRETLRDAVFL